MTPIYWGIPQQFPKTRFLSHFTLHPMVWAFERMLRYLSRMFRWQLLARTDAIKPLRTQHLLLLTNQVDEIHPELEERLTAWGCYVDIEPLRLVRSPMTGGDAAEALA